MNLDFSLLTFSPSSRKTSKSSSLNKKCSKLAVKNKRLISTIKKDDENSNKPYPVLVSKHKTAETTKNGHCDKALVKQRINKGKENRYDISATITSDWQESSLARGSRKSRRELSIENADAKKKRLVDVAPVQPSYSASDRLRSAINETFSSGEKTSECVASTFTSISNYPLVQEPRVPTLKFIQETNENKFNDVSSDIVAPSVSSVIIISDTSRLSSGRNNSALKKEPKSGKCRKCNKNINTKKITTVVVESSDSENDENSEVSLNLHSSSQTPRTIANKHTSLKKGTTIVLESSDSEIDVEEKGIKNSIQQNLSSPSLSHLNTPAINNTRCRAERFVPRINSTPLPVCEEPLQRSKYKDIENWLAKIPVNSSVSDASNSSTIHNKEAAKNSSESKENLSTSTEDILKNIYGADLQYSTKNPKATPTVIKRRLVYSSDGVTPSPKKKDKVQKTPKANASPIKHLRTPRTNRRKTRTSQRLSISTSEPNFLASLSSSTIGPVHPEGEFYRKNFKRKKEELTSKLFKLYNSQVFNDKLPANMQIEWNIRMKKTAGFCYNRRQLLPSGEKIRTSRLVLSIKESLYYGVRNKCEAWRSIGRHSKSLNLATKRCGYCLGKFELLVNRRRKSGTVVQQTINKRSPVGFARFVKENYNSVKTSHINLKHADVMRLLGQQFSAVKIDTKKQGS
ncbi:hypothetical protein C0J52_01073 [Blattella germanica]|nr:hypothetical protein C0J52_01073 [Blattella germanica]